MKNKIFKTLSLIIVVFAIVGCVDKPSSSNSNSSSSSTSSHSSILSTSSSSASSISLPANAINLAKTNGIVEAENYTYAINCQLENTSDVGGGKNVGWIEDGTILRYSVYFNESGYYQTKFRVSGDGTGIIGEKLHMYVDDVKILSVYIIATGGWQNWDYALQYGYIEQGLHTLELKATGGGFNLNKMEFIKVANSEAEFEQETEISHAPVKVSDAVDYYLTSTEQSGSGAWYNSPKTITNKLKKQEPLDITEQSDINIATISIDPSKTYQSLLGLGTSLEESSVNNIAKLNDTTRKAFLKSLLDPINGAGMTLFRITIGTADFTAQDQFYTYYDVKTTTEPDWLNGFSIQKDIDLKIVQTLQELLQYAEELGVKDDIKIFASSWTPPGWMKKETSASRSYANNSLLLKGGELKDEYIDDLAMYYTRFVEEYAKLGINIYALTLQNEPLLEIDYPSCKITATQEGKLAIELKKKISESSILSEKNIDPKLWAFDHNFSEAEAYMNELFRVSGAKDAIDGVAFHDYSGSPETMQTMLNKLNPNQTVSLTERSVWGVEGASRIIQYLRNGAVSYNAWVTMLDSNIGVHHWLGTPGPTMLVRKAGSDSQYWETPEFYMMGNFSNFIRPGYVRVESTKGSAYTVDNVVFKNPNTNQLVAVIVNRTNVTQRVKIQFGNSEFITSVPKGNIATYVWNY